MYSLAVCTFDEAPKYLIHYHIGANPELTALEESIDFGPYKLFDLWIDKGDLQVCMQSVDTKILADPVPGFKPPRNTDAQLNPRLKFFQLFHQNSALNFRKFIESVQD